MSIQSKAVEAIETTIQRLKSLVSLDNDQSLASAFNYPPLFLHTHIHLGEHNIPSSTNAAFKTSTHFASQESPYVDKDHNLDEILRKEAVPLSGILKLTRDL